MVVNFYRVLDDTHQAHSAAVWKICPYINLDNEIKLLNDGHVFLAFTCKVLDSVVFYQAWVKELLALVSLFATWVEQVRNLEHLVESYGYCFGVFNLDWKRPGKFAKYVDYGEQVPHSAVLPGNAMHISQVNLPLSINHRNIGMVPCELTARGLVKRMSLLVVM